MAKSLKALSTNMPHFIYSVIMDVTLQEMQAEFADEQHVRKANR